MGQSCRPQPTRWECPQASPRHRPRRPRTQPRAQSTQSRQPPGETPQMISCGAGRKGSTTTSTTPPLKQLIWCTVIPVRGTATPSGVSGTSLASPSANDASASEITVGWAQLPPIQPCSLPCERMTALSPGRHDVGRSARTTVATATASPRDRCCRSWVFTVGLHRGLERHLNPPPDISPPERASSLKPERTAIRLRQCQRGNKCTATYPWQGVSWKWHGDRTQFGVQSPFNSIRTRCRGYPVTPWSRRTFQTFERVIGMSMCRTARCHSASTTAFTIAGGAPTRRRLANTLRTEWVLR